MWRVLLALVFHRLLLLGVALVALSFQPTAPSPTSLPTPTAPPAVAKPHQLQSFSYLCHAFAGKMRETPEARTLERLRELPFSAIFSETHNPFLWVERLIIKLTHLPTVVVMIFLSNLFLFFFLWELNALMNRMVTPDTAVSATILMLLWPTSYELSLGSPLAFSAFLVCMAIRQALDDQWALGGIALAVLALFEPLGVGLVPLLAYLFWYFQRGYPAGDVIRKMIWFFLPVAGVIFWRRADYLHLGSAVQNSAFFALFSKSASHTSLAWSFSKTLAGQTITVAFFVIGAVAAAITNSTLVHRLIPLYSGFLWLLFSPYEALASRAPLAAVCLQGIASISARPALKIIQVLLLVLSVFEVAALF